MITAQALISKDEFLVGGFEPSTFSLLFYLNQAVTVFEMRNRLVNHYAVIISR